MSVSNKHVLEQLPVLRTLGEVALSALAKKPAGGPVPAAPGPWIEATLPPRSAELIRDYVRHVGGDPASYRGTVPPHLFPQWGFPLAARAIADIPWALTRVMNAGVRLEIRSALPADEPLLVKARLESIDANERRAILTQRIVTSTPSTPEAIVADLHAFVPLGKKEKGGAREARPTVPGDAREIAFLRIPANAGLDFAKLTGDFNPIHWIAPYARAAGFRATILHGFGTMARAIEAVNRRVFAGDARALRLVEVKFTRPLVLPAKVGVYVKSDGGLWVGDAPGGGIYLDGRFEPARTHS